MSLSEAVDRVKAAEEKKPCAFGAILAGLSDADRAVYEQMLTDRKPVSYIHEVFMSDDEHVYTVSLSTVRSHVRGACSCP